MSDTIACGPVFIGGPHRSGTGMIRAVLGSNSRLALPPREYQFFERFRRDLHADLGPDAPAVLAEVLRWPKVRQFGLPPLDTAALVAQSGHDVRSIYAAPLKAYARMVGKPRFGEKTPYLEHHFETLLAWFGPRVRFVHIIRDPMPTFASLCCQFGKRQPLDPLRFARHWRASLLRGLDQAARYPDQYLLLRYEAFTVDPVAWIARLCDFCDLPRETDHMLTMRDFARKRNSSFAIAPQPRPEPHPIVPADSRRATDVSWIERRIIERELGAFVDPGTARLPNSRPELAAMIAERDSPGSPAAAYLVTLWVRLLLRLRRRGPLDRVQ